MLMDGIRCILSSVCCCGARTTTQKNTNRRMGRAQRNPSATRDQANDGFRCALPILRIALGFPETGFPEFDLVPLGIHDPRELAVLVRLGTTDDRHASLAQPGKHFVQVVAPIVDQDRKSTRLNSSN